MSVALGLCLQPAKIPEVLSHVPNLLLQLVNQGCMCADSVCMIISLVKVIPIIKKGSIGAHLSLGS